MEERCADHTDQGFLNCMEDMGRRKPPHVDASILEGKKFERHKNCRWANGQAASQQARTLHV